MKKNMYLMALIVAAVAIVGYHFIAAQFLTVNSGGQVLIGPRANLLITATHQDGTVFAEEFIHNIIMNKTKNDTAKCIIGRVNCTGNYTYIGLGNSTTPTDADLTLAGEIAEADGSGLGRNDTNAITYGTAALTINASVSYEWTAADECLVNTTGLFNASSDGVMIAASDFADITLQAGDKLNITWWILVT